MNEIEKMYENVGIEPEYRYDCNLADTIKPVEVFPLHRCSKSEIKDYCTNKQDYRYCKVYKVNKIYPPFTAEKQLLLLQLLARIESADYFQFFFYEIKQEWVFRLNVLTELSCESAYIYESRNKNFDECIAGLINIIWQSLSEEEKQQVKGILE